MTATPANAPVRVGVVLSGGGLRGAAHLGVLRRLVRHQVPIDVMVGVSAGAVVAAFYAAIGVSVEELIADARVFRGRHLLMHGLTLRLPRTVRGSLRPFTGIIPARLQQLERGRFESLHYGVQRLGIVCHDMVSGRAVYFSTLEHFDAPFAAVVRSSAAVPGLLPTRPLVWNGRRVHLVDGGLSDSLPCKFAASMGATHLIVSDCRRIPTPLSAGPAMVYIRPELPGAGVLRAPAGSLLECVAQGEAAVSNEALAVVRRWTAAPALGSVAASSVPPAQRRPTGALA